MSNLPDKSVEPIALKAGVAPRTLQEFLSQLKWDQDKLRDRLQDIVRTEHAGRHAIGDLRRDQLRQEGGQDARRATAVVRHRRQERELHGHRPLGLRRDDFHCLLDGELFLPEDWSDDRERCREAGIPDDDDLPAQVADRPGTAMTAPWATASTSTG